MALSPGSFTPVDPQPEEVEELDPLITPADVEGWTQGKLRASTVGLDKKCAGVSRAIRDYCGWHIFPVLEIHDLMDGPGGRILQLPSRYLRSVEALRWRGDELPVGSYRHSLSGFVEYEPAGTEGWPWPTLGVWPTGFRVLDVEFTSGYSKVPESMVQLASGIAARAAASPLGYTREQSGTVGVSFGGADSGAGGGIALLASEKEVLDPYRIMGV